MMTEPDGTLNESRALEGARGGDQLAYRALYQIHHQRIYALCLRMLGDRGLAEDALQESFVLAWRRLGQFRGQAAFGSWLHRIAVNQCVSMLRSKWSWLVFSERTDANKPDSTSPGKEVIHDLERAVRELPLRPRQVLVLHDIEGYTHGEVAKALGIAVGTSKTQLHRARKQLKEWLEDA